MKGVVYDPPRLGLPHLAVVFKPDGSVLTAEAVSSVAQGEALIAHVFNSFAEAKNSGKI
jgi:hypothetical protein